MKITNNRFFKLILILILVGLAESGLLYAQSERDSLSIDQVIKLVIESHPSVKQAAMKLDQSDYKIALTETQYYPNIDIDVSYSRVGPVPVLEFPGMGEFKLFPADNFDAAVKIKENIYDFGRNDSKAALYKSDKKIAGEALERSKQGLAESAIMNYYALLYLQQAIKIKNEEIKTLDEHIQFIQTKTETGSATEYDILSTKVRKSVIESSKADLVSAYNTKLAEMRALLGYDKDKQLLISTEIQEKSVEFNSDAAFNYAYAHRNELLESMEELNKAELNVKVIETENNPSIGVMLSGGFKNGYLPDLNEITANFVAGVNLSVPLYDGTRTAKKADYERVAVESKKEGIELIKRKINNEIVASRENILVAKQKLDQSVLQQQNAAQAFKLAQINFKAGGITNLEMLDAETNVSESNLMVLKAKVDYAAGLYKFMAVIGQRLY